MGLRVSTPQLASKVGAHVSVPVSPLQEIASTVSCFLSSALEPSCKTGRCDLPFLLCVGVCLSVCLSVCYVCLCVVCLVMPD